MGDKAKESEFTLQSTKSELSRNYSTKSIVSSDNKEPDYSAECIFFSILDMINHLLIVLVTLFIVYEGAKEYYNVTNIHVILCTIGYILLMSEAFVVLASNNVLTGSFSHQTKKHLHWILQALGLIFNLVGVIFMYNNKKVHFTSIHGITGLTSLVIVLVLTAFGYPVWIAFQLRKFVRPVIIKFFHNFLGISSFVIGMVSQCYGYNHSWVSVVTKIKYADTILMIITIIITLLSLRGALISLYKQGKNCLK
ncbi:hypothetical protein PUN28_011009 [Cardiocondyla obscurior]|uniref:ascorbate ferrireductase (transmembrane) n=1 Tax=Cardiocondyla obscurior TaxID=286306 RepID=A0AAW2FIR3_9HYME